MCRIGERRQCRPREFLVMPSSMTKDTVFAADAYLDWDCQEISCGHRLTASRECSRFRALKGALSRGHQEPRFRRVPCSATRVAPYMLFDCITAPTIWISLYALSNARRCRHGCGNRVRNIIEARESISAFRRVRLATHKIVMRGAEQRT